GHVSRRRSPLQEALWLKEVRGPHPLGLGVMDGIKTLDSRYGKARPGSKVDMNRQNLPGRVEVDVPHEPRRADAESCLKKLLLHPSPPRLGCHPLVLPEITVHRRWG